MQASLWKNKLSQEMYKLLYEVAFEGNYEIPKKRLLGLTVSDLSYIESKSDMIAYYRRGRKYRHVLRPRNFWAFISYRNYKPDDFIYLPLSVEDLYLDGLIEKKKTADRWYFVLGPIVIDPLKYPQLYLIDDDTARTLFAEIGDENIYEKYKDYIEKPSISNIYFFSGKLAKIKKVLPDGSRLEAYIGVEGGKLLLEVYGYTSDYHSASISLTVDKFSVKTIEEAMEKAQLLLFAAEEHAKTVEEALLQIWKSRGFGVSTREDRDSVDTSVNVKAKNFSVNEFEVNGRASITLSPLEEIKVYLEIGGSRDSSSYSVSRTWTSSIRVVYLLNIGELSTLEYADVLFYQLAESIFPETSVVSIDRRRLKIEVRFPFRGAAPPLINNLCEKIARLKDLIADKLEGYIVSDKSFLSTVDRGSNLKYGEILEILKWREKQTAEEKLFALLALKIENPQSKLLHTLSRIAMLKHGADAEKYLKDPIATILRLVRNGDIVVKTDRDRSYLEVYAYGKRLDEMFDRFFGEKLSRFISAIITFTGYHNYVVYFAKKGSGGGMKINAYQ